MKKYVIFLVFILSGTFAQAGSPQEQCRASLHAAYQKIPHSMLDLCSLANPYSASAINRFTLTYTSLPQDIMELLIAVKTKKELSCVVYIADRYTSVTQYFIARVCFDSIFLNY